MNPLYTQTSACRSRSPATASRTLRAGAVLFTVGIGLACSGGGTSEAPLDEPEPEEALQVATPRGPDRWIYNSGRADAMGIDRLSAPFDQLIAPCELSHEGTGGIGRVWHPDDDCRLGPDGFLMKGEWTSICYGASPGQHPPWCDPEDASENERVERLIPVTIERGCAVRFDGYPFTAMQGCSH